MTRPRLQVVLAAEEDRTLLELRTANSVPQRTKNRAEVRRLSHRGWTTNHLSEKTRLRGIVRCTPDGTPPQVAGSRYGVLRAIVAAGSSNPQHSALGTSIAAGAAGHVESTATTVDSQKRATAGNEPDKAIEAYKTP